MPRFHCPLPLQVGREVTLPEAVARHALGALRLRAGDAVTLFNGDGTEYLGRLDKAGKGSSVHITECRAVDRESPLAITLAQGISSGERMDYTLQKAVELGVAHLQPVMMRRTVSRLDPEKREKRRLHWQGVAISACEQCGRNRIPEVAAVRDFPDWVRQEALAFPLRFILDPAGTQRLQALPPAHAPVLLLAGPEGGFDPAERDAALAAGFQPLQLGPRILRTETAAVATLAAMQALWGDL